MAIKWYHPGPYPVCIGFCTDEKSFRKELKELRVPNRMEVGWVKPGGALYTHLESAKGDTVYIISIELTDRKWPCLAGLIAHEAAHLVTQLWVDLGEQYPGSEANSYMIQYITQRCLEDYAKLSKKAGRDIGVPNDKRNSRK
jgi:hypothetical protein